MSQILCVSDQNKIVNKQFDQNPQNGYIDKGCSCLVCKASSFGSFVCPPSLPGYKIPICGPVLCHSSPALVYHLQCASGRKECRLAHYVGAASTSNPNIKPMSARWSNHKSHHKHSKNNCAMTDHLLLFHKNENPQDFVKITLLEACDMENLKRVETKWCYKLFSYIPHGLNLREEIST